MSLQPTAPAYNGKVTVTLGGQPRALQFGMNTLRDYTKLAGGTAGGLGADLARDPNEALLNLVFCAISRYTPQAELPDGFLIDHVADWIDEMSAADGTLLSQAIAHSIQTHNPLMSALLVQLVPAAPTREAPTAIATDGITSSTSPLAT